MFVLLKCVSDLIALVAWCVCYLGVLVWTNLSCVRELRGGYDLNCVSYASELFPVEMFGLINLWNFVLICLLRLLILF